MKPFYRIHLISVAILLLLATLACGLGSGATSLPKTPIALIHTGGDLTQIDLCQAIPKEDIEASMSHKLVRAPQRTNYGDTPGATGCTYDAGKDPSGNAFFGYVVLAPVSLYNTQLLYKNVDVKGIGQQAYFNNGADARQLWVKVNEKIAFVIAFGDRPNEDGARALAKLLADAIVK